MTIDAVPVPAGTNDGALHRQLFERLDGSIAELWAQANNSEFWQDVLTSGFDRELYRIAMTQIYHYTRHNSLNQAVAVFGADPDDIGLLRFVYGSCTTCGPSACSGQMTASTSSRCPR